MCHAAVGIYFIYFQRASEWIFQGWGDAKIHINFVCPKANKKGQRLVLSLWPKRMKELQRIANVSRVTIANFERRRKT